MMGARKSRLPPVYLCQSVATCLILVPHRHTTTRAFDTHVAARNCPHLLLQTHCRQQLKDVCPNLLLLQICREMVVCVHLSVI